MNSIFIVTSIVMTTYLYIPKIICHPRLMNKMLKGLTIILEEMFSIPDKVMYELLISEQVSCPFPQGTIIYVI